MSHQNKKTFIEFKDAVCSKFSKWGEKDIDYWFWDNSKLYPANKVITSGSTTMYYLRHARDHDTLDKIQNHIDPLAFTVRVYKSGFSCDHYYTFRCFHLSMLRYLAADEKVRSIGDLEHETWGTYRKDSRWDSSVQKKMWGFFNESV